LPTTRSLHGILNGYDSLRCYGILITGGSLCSYDVGGARFARSTRYTTLNGSFLMFGTLMAPTR